MSSGKKMHRTALIILAPIVVATLGELAAATRDEDPKSIISAQTPQSAIQDMQPQSPTRMCGCCNARTQATGFASLRIWPPRSNASTRASTATSECRQTSENPFLSVSAAVYLSLRGRRRQATDWSQHSGQNPMITSRRPAAISVDCTLPSPCLDIAQPIEPRAG